MKKLYIANAGDSRCVLGRGGKAIPLSFDHKPEDEIERDRIEKAGSTIMEGRVDGNLNLSRSLGDLKYKMNKSLKPEE
jgi:serine/threonine protein phosphatase PrpC